MRQHHDEHSYVPGSKRTGEYQARGFMVGSYIKPTLTEQGIDVDEFIKQNRHLIERLRKGNH